MRVVRILVTAFALLTGLDTALSQELRDYDEVEVNLNAGTFEHDDFPFDVEPPRT